MIYLDTLFVVESTTSISCHRVSKTRVGRLTIDGVIVDGRGIDDGLMVHESLKRGEGLILVRGR